MSHFEYRMVPLMEPTHTGDALDGQPESFVRAMSEHANALSRAGWEYVRSDTLTTSRRSFWGKTEESVSVLVFRRPYRSDGLFSGVTAQNVRPPREAMTGPRLAFSQPETQH